MEHSKDLVINLENITQHVFWATAEKKPTNSTDGLHMSDSDKNSECTEVESASLGMKHHNDKNLFTTLFFLF